MMIDPALVNLAIALGLGLLVGLQRESSRTREGGLRTFALITLLGTAVATLAPRVSPWLVPVAFLGVALLTLMTYFRAKSSDDPGMTTEVALLLMFVVGVYIVVGEKAIAIILGGGVAVLLQAKGRFRGIMERLGEGDVRAVMQFALLSLVILPALPDVSFGPFDVLNLHQTWLLVVLIVGINLGGYIAYRFLGGSAGALLAGVLGGLISSTATTVSYSRRTKGEDDSSRVAAVVIMIATSVVLARIIVLIGIVARTLLETALLPIGIVFAVSIVLSLLIWRSVRGTGAEMPEQENPTRLRPALVFALVYVLVLLAAAWTRHRFGEHAVYAVAAVSGLTDVDAITLTTARLTSGGQIAAESAWRIILVAYVSNLVFKAGVIAVAGSRWLLARVGLLFAILAAASILTIVFA